MYTLYYYPLNASLAPHLILEELNVEYDLQLVDRKTNAQKSAQYLALNPAGRIPTLVDKGQAIFESPAICLHLAEQHPESNLLPEIGNTNRAIFFQWMMYLTNTLQAELMIYFYPEKHTTNTQCAPEIKAAQDKRISEMLALINKELTNKTYLIGEQFTACDYFLFMLCVWADELETPPLAFENLKRYLVNVAQREAVKTVCHKEGISLNDYQA